MGIIRRNNAEGGPPGTGVTAANSGGRSGDAFDVVQTHAQFAYIAASGDTVPQGAVGYRIGIGATPGISYGQWNLTNDELWGSWLCAFHEAAGGSSQVQVCLQLLTSADVQIGSMEYNTNTGKVGVMGQGGAGRADTTGTHTVNVQIMRIDFHFKLGTFASGGRAEARVYFDYVGASQTYEAINATSDVGVAGTMAKFRIGLMNTPAVGYEVHWFDDILLDDRNWIDRRPHPVSRMGRVLSS